MIVLGLDTSGYANAIGVVDGKKVLADNTFEARTDSLEKIVTNIEDTLRSAGLTLKDVTGIGVGLGPGSWTGIRVGVTLGKMLAYSTGKPVGGVPTLEALAYTAGNEASQICSIISAGIKDTVYAGFYHALDGNIARTGEYYVGDVRELAERVGESTVLVGSEAESYCTIIGQALDLSKISIKAVEAAPNGSVVALLAASRLKRGESDDVLSLTPLYLKESTARAFINRYAVNAQIKGQV
ncbi:tRNA (adenosine(37)-N6)-threonylcarbamoyltransferase complex dimerization subunit type 1 TsaB [Chloroflexota bacterium]